MSSILIERENSDTGTPCFTSLALNPLVLNNNLQCLLLLAFHFYNISILSADYAS